MSWTKPLNPQQAASHLDRYFQKARSKSPQRPLQIRVYSQKLGLNYCFPDDSTNQPFHTASIGKQFTAVLVLKLAEKGRLDLSDPIVRYLSPVMLERLFVYQDHDYAQQVTIEHLLGHTSGVADYFEGKTISGRPFIEEVLANPRFHWTPQALLDYSRDHQAAAGAPGKVFNYSDTGYILLGLLIETITGKSFSANLDDEIFNPLGMDNSYLMFYPGSRNIPNKTIEKVWFNGVEISEYESLSCDWSGGGVISTTADLLKFNQALRDGGLVSPKNLEAMDACQHKFRQGIYYGLGMMEIRFKEFFFLLGGLPKVKGHIGILATHLFYDPVSQAHVIMNFGDNTRMVESFKALIEIENVIQRLRQ